MITIFENYRNKPNLNIDSDFWDMVEFINWDELIKYYNKYPITDEHADFFKKLQYKLYSKYKYKDIQNFFNTYNDIYYELYDYFLPIINKLNISNDDYTDVISSIIGKGKKFTQHCISDDNIVFDMVKTNDYVDNFSYLLQIDYDEYKNILTEYPKFGYSMN